MPTARGALSSIEKDNLIYVLGGIPAVGEPTLRGSSRSVNYQIAMRKHIIFLICILCCQILLSQEKGRGKVFFLLDTVTTELYRDSYALIIGISEYTNGWPRLNGVSKDIQLVGDALESHGFHTVIAENQTRTELDRTLGEFINKFGQNPQHRILIYFAGHGHTVWTSYGEELGYIVPSDTPNPVVDPAGFKNKAIPISQFEILAKQIDSKHALFMFDACFSGSIFSNPRAVPDAISYKTTLPVRQFITSGSANENVPDESIFRKEFITAITTDIADANKDGYLTGSELGEYLQTSVINYSYNQQHPQHGKLRNPNLDKGDFVFELAHIQESDTAKIAYVPKILQTKRFQDKLFNGLYLQTNASFGYNAQLVQFSLYYSTRYIGNRYCIGLYFSTIRTVHTQIVETFPGLLTEHTENYTFNAFGLYQRLFLFPQNQSFVNLYAGASVSWNNWQFTLGLRPILTKWFMFEIEASYIVHNGEINYREFSFLGNSSTNPEKYLFSDFFLGINLQFFISRR